ncbi:MAG: CBS domain-containing protein [Gammaproteobacteria bacterium]|nr:CBS domain-containing protein [Gammaproteobacteria bacterium]
MTVEPPPGPHPARGWLNRLTDPLRTRLAALLHPGARNRQDLIRYVHDAESRHLIDVDTAVMMEGAVLVSETKVLDIMIPRSDMIFIDVDATPAEFLPKVIESAHSRFPVLDAKHEKVIGILLAKDLLPLAGAADRPFNIRDILRPAVFVPESKRLNILLREFRQSRNHLAIVIDEYGGIAGLVSIEDVIEQIVGEIDDEYDVDDEEFIRVHRANRYTIKGRTPIAAFNDYFKATFSDREYDTIGGLVVHEFGRLPERGDEIEFGGFHFKVLRADPRRVNVLRVMRSGDAQAADARGSAGEDA